MSLNNLLHVDRWTWGAAAWGLALSLGLFVGSLVVVVVLLVQLPPTYFLSSHRAARPQWKYPALRWTALILKNLVGAALIVAGLIMLMAPGQGLLTLLVGLMLLDIPGKRRLEQRIVRRERVLNAINWLRSRFSKPPLVVSDSDAG